MTDLCLTKEELIEVTGRQNNSAQIKWFLENEFTLKVKADGQPLVSRDHFLQKMGYSPDYQSDNESSNFQPSEPNWDAMP